MKPKEFDELVRQKFDQNDFAYEPRNWDALAEQMDGRAKKRNVMMWWLMPLAGIAASVAMAMGVTFFYQSENGTRSGKTAAIQSGSNSIINVEKPRTIQNEPVTAMAATTQQYLTITKTKNNRPTIAPAKKSIEEKFAISFENAVGFSSASAAKSFVFKEEHIPVKDKKAVAQNEGFPTFKPEDEAYKKPATTFITLTGGVNHGNENSGYMAGANIRHMVNSKLYIESDVAFANSSNSQVTEVLAPTAGSSSVARHTAAAGRVTALSGEKPTTTDGTTPKIEDENQSYTLNYVQLSPGLGYKVMNKMSLGIGPDFQQMLGDTRPATSTVDRNNIAVAPLFDIGFMGKTEYAVTKKVKAGVVYRKGINNLLTPMDKYIDRDYLQFQLKCTIFNK